MTEPAVVEFVEVERVVIMSKCGFVNKYFVVELEGVTGWPYVRVAVTSDRVLFGGFDERHVILFGGRGVVVRVQRFLNEYR